MELLLSTAVVNCLVTVCDEASKELCGVGWSVTQQVNEQVSQLVSHQQTKQVAE